MNAHQRQPFSAALLSSCRLSLYSHLLRDSFRFDLSQVLTGEDIQGNREIFQNHTAMGSIITTRIKTTVVENADLGLKSAVQINK